MSGTWAASGSDETQVRLVVAARWSSSRVRPCEIATRMNTAPTDARVTARVTSGVKNQ